jgi:hypothetical protein
MHAVWEPEGRDGLKRGQVRISLNKAAKEWGFTRAQGRRFLQRCVSEGDIEWERGRGGRPKTTSQGAAPSAQKSGPVSVPVSVPVSGVMTICHYDRYQTGFKKGEPVSVPVSVPLSGNSPANNKKERTAATDPVAASPAVKAKKARRSPGSDPRVKELVDAYFRLFREIRGHAYVVNGAKDAAAIKRMLGTLDPEDITARMAQFLRDDDPWLERQGYTIAVFATRVNCYHSSTIGGAASGNASQCLPSSLEESLRRAYGDDWQEVLNRG